MAPALRYGAIGLPLAFAALPMVVLMPAHYAQRGVPLATVGALLLAVRLLDALWDPLAGRWADAALARGARSAARLMAGAGLALGTGFVALFGPPAALAGRPLALVAWAAAALVLTAGAYSLASVLHQAWGARQGGDDGDQSRLAAAREGAGLVGVMLASLLPAWLGWPATGALLALALGVGWWALVGTAVPPVSPSQSLPVSAPESPRVSPAEARHDASTRPRATLAAFATLAAPWRAAPFRRLMLVFMLNGIANAVPATLLVFFLQDRLQAPAWTAAALATYFGCGVLSLPLWVAQVPRLGLRRTWALGMGLAVLAFCGATMLGPGDARWFLLVCAASGLTLGADLAVPPALLARLLRARAADRAAEGLHFGWWTAATKLNLALAAGLALPALQALGYAPGTREPAALQALALAYAALPCALKLLALAALWRLEPLAPSAAAAPPSAAAPAPALVERSCR